MGSLGKRPASARRALGLRGVCGSGDGIYVSLSGGALQGRQTLE